MPRAKSRVCDVTGLKPKKLTFIKIKATLKL